MPHNAAGCRTDPPVSLPNAIGVMPAATETAEPALDPPLVRFGSHGLRVGPKAEFSEELPMANSSMFVMPTGIAPASIRRCTKVAVYGARQPARILLAQFDSNPSTHMFDLSATGTPCKRPGCSPS